MNISVKVKGLEQFDKFLKEFPTDIEERMHELIRNVCDNALFTATVNFDLAEYDGVNDVVVDKELELGRLYAKGTVFATGSSVLFIEYGTGVYYNGGGYPHPSGAEDGMVPIGTYGWGQGSKPYWFFKARNGATGTRSTKSPNKIITHGNPPNMCMWYTRKEMENTIKEEAEKVFKW